MHSAVLRNGGGRLKKLLFLYLLMCFVLLLSACKAGAHYIIEPMNSEPSETAAAFSSPQSTVKDRESENCPATSVPEEFSDSSFSDLAGSDVSASEATHDSDVQVSESVSEKLSTNESDVQASEQDTETLHAHDYRVQVFAPTCESAGYAVCSCDCGETYIEEREAPLGHSYIETVILPTADSEGYTEHTCEICGQSYVDNFTPRLPRVYDTEEAASAGNAYASACGFSNDPALLLDGASTVCTMPAEMLHQSGGQSALNSAVVREVNAAVMLLAQEAPNLGYVIFCEVAYSAAEDTYLITVFYGAER